jgi:HEAT repeat protein
VTDDKEQSVRIAAIRALGKIGTRAELEPLLQPLADGEDEDLAVVAAKTLEGMGPAANAEDPAKTADATAAEASPTAAP